MAMFFSKHLQVEMDLARQRALHYIGNFDLKNLARLIGQHDTFAAFEIRA